MKMQRKGALVTVLITVTEHLTRSRLEEGFTSARGVMRGRSAGRLLQDSVHISADQEAETR